GVVTLQLSKQAGHDDGHRHEYTEQHEDAEIQAQQIRMPQDIPCSRLHDVGFLPRHRRHREAGDKQADKASRLIAQKRPDSPKAPTIMGDSTSEAAKDSPIDAPTIAMARVRTSGRVASATHAVMAAETAPRPCKVRPAMIQFTFSAKAQMMPPTTKSTMPATITVRRP